MYEKIADLALPPEVYKAWINAKLAQQTNYPDQIPQARAELEFELIRRLAGKSPSELRDLTVEHLDALPPPLLQDAQSKPIQNSKIDMRYNLNSPNTSSFAKGLQ